MLSAAEAAKRAVHHVTEMTGRTAESVVGIHRAGNGGGEEGDGGDGWCVTVEVVETHRIPDSADILAVYEAEVDGDGELVSYRRVRRYPRGRTGKD
ncbi:gas vesicle protein GvpO [Spirillospora sp. NPDC029432]|uniref:gas vesicle protein GvpO n=1 Tax=Spirillospora sp. NPDC029432 TaxID=3154599 RepID=UPI003451A3A3